MHFEVRRQLQLRQPPQVFLQDLSLDRELMFVARMLVVASTASREIRTPRLNPFRRSLDNRIDARPTKPRLLVDKRRLHLLARQHKRHKHSLAAASFIPWKARQSVSTVDQFFDSEVHANELALSCHPGEVRRRPNEVEGPLVP